MNNRLRRRLVVVTGVIVMVIVVVLATVGAATGYETVTVAEATSGSFNGSRVQVTGKVVDNSYSLEGDVLSFSIYEDAEGTGTTGAGNANAGTDAASESTHSLKVIYDKGFSATFGNQVEAICTGTIGTDGVLKCTELVTKCPSKYESSVDALTVSQLLSYDRQIIDKPVKVIGKLKAGTLTTVGRGDRFILVDADEAGAVGTAGAVGAVGAADTANTATAAANELPVRYEGALSDEIQDGTTLVLTGSLNASGRFEATDVALKG